MATLAESLVSSSSRSIAIRVRPDLQAKRQKYQGNVYWVVKDPIALQYFRFEEEEFAILQMLDGESSLEEIADRFEAEFPPQTIRPEELQQFIGMLHRSGLVLANAGGQGEQLKKRRDERRKKEMVGRMSNILSIRFKGIDPEGILNLLYSFPPVRWFFSVPAMVLCLLLVAAASTLVLVQFDVFYARLPDFQSFFAVKNWLLLAVVLGCTKVLHEFGHGLSCKHFGGECHEMGVMFLVLTPCLYCNVSDSWMLPSRWHRAAIGAAGMYVEVVLASFCTFVWWFTDPASTINQICLNIMFVSSVSTIMFNANPLLRYDGYYILSDLLEIPNMRQKAQSILTRKLGHLCLGIEPPEDPFLPKRNQGWFAAYTVASTIYRWVVVFSIIYFLNKVFEPYGLKPLGQLIATMAIYGMLVMPLVKLYKYFKVPGRMAKVKKLRMLASFAVVAAVIAGVMLIPFPSAVYAPVELKAYAPADVYTESEGLLSSIHVRPGQRVRAGDKIAELSNIDIRLKIERLRGEVQKYEAKIRDLDVMSLARTEAAEQRSQVLEMLAAAREQLAQTQKDAARLVITAPADGVVLPPPYKGPQPNDEYQLSDWHGTPLDEDNLGATLPISTHLCQIYDPERLEALLVIDESEETDLLADRRVELLFKQSTDFTFVSRVREVSTKTMKTTPPRLSSLAGGDVATEMDPSGTPRPMTPQVSADALLIKQPNMPDDAREAFELLRVGLTGKAKIHAEPRTLAQRLWRYLSRTVKFDL
ncbi:putative peptide zinc metalloprotease protein YydH [Posidoniimonas polymericola]|uniref:Putative peptide zinc metalloprotease protein YydH n=1 Tax=Posidoniimonas polymericola TaxID=2528002 RepID=A0A5C5ZF39_9BACT|nr:efflux RND transporter periplasmic adaptor subunit [Posidoniimonas polymericola]TWT85677.1 putative peptide zinc metalloprotease protein YydH [Posidoniimonas polymericola]